MTRYPYIGGSLDGLTVGFENMAATPAIKLNGEIYRFQRWQGHVPAYVYRGRYDEKKNSGGTGYQDSYGEGAE